MEDRFKNLEIFENISASMLIEAIPLFAGFIELGREHYRDNQDSEELAKEIVNWWIKNYKKENLFKIIKNDNKELFEVPQ